MPRTLLAAGLGLALGIGLGFALADLVLPVPAPPGAPAVADQPKDPQDAAGEAALRQLVAQQETCVSDLETARFDLAAVRATYEGHPVTDFPEGWDGVLTDAARIQRAAEQAIEACELPLSVIAVDCDEAPCLAWFERRDGSDITKAFLADCPTWSLRYNALAGTAQGRLETDDGPRRYWMRQILPVDETPPGGVDNHQLRFVQRVAEQRAALMELWQGWEAEPQQLLAELQDQLVDGAGEAGTQDSVAP